MDINVDQEAVPANRFWGAQRISVVAFCSILLFAARSIEISGFDGFPEVISAKVPVMTRTRTQQQQHQQKEEKQQQERQEDFSRLYLEKEGTGDNICNVISRTRLYSPLCNNSGNTTSLPPRRLLVTGTGRSGTSFLQALASHAGLRVSHDTLGGRREPGINELDGAVSWPHAFNLNAKNPRCEYPSWSWIGRRRLQEQQQPQNWRNFLHIFHVVRQPLKTLTSRWNMGKFSKANIYRYISCEQQLKPCPRFTALNNNHYSSWPGFNATNAAKYFPEAIRWGGCTIFKTVEHWVLWNSFVETYAERRFRIEEDNEEMIHELHRLASQPGIEDHSDTVPFPPIMNVTELKLFRQNSDTSISNSGHTAKLWKPFTWKRLMKIDRNYTVMAQFMAHRYGYAVKISAEDQKMRQVCGLDANRRWGCSLVPEESLVDDATGNPRYVSALEYNHAILSRAR